MKLICMQHLRLHQKIDIYSIHAYVWLKIDRKRILVENYNFGGRGRSWGSGGLGIYKT